MMILEPGLLWREDGGDGDDGVEAAPLSGRHHPVPDWFFPRDMD